MSSLAGDTHALLKDLREWMHSVPQPDPDLREDDDVTLRRMIDAEVSRAEMARIAQENATLNHAAASVLMEAFNERFELRLLDILRRFDEANIRAAHIPGAGPTVEHLAWAYSRPGDWERLITDLEDRLERIEAGQ